MNHIVQILNVIQSDLVIVDTFVTRILSTISRYPLYRIVQNYAKSVSNYFRVLIHLLSKLTHSWHFYPIQRHFKRNYNYFSSFSFNGQKTNVLAICYAWRYLNLNENVSFKLTKTIRNCLNMSTITRYCPNSVHYSEVHCYRGTLTLKLHVGNAKIVHYSEVRGPLYRGTITYKNVCKSYFRPL